MPPVGLWTCEATEAESLYKSSAPLQAVITDNKATPITSSSLDIPSIFVRIIFFYEGAESGTLLQWCAIVNTLPKIQSKRKLLTNFEILLFFHMGHKTMQLIRTLSYQMVEAT